MLDTRGDHHHAPAVARCAQADEEEKEKLAHRMDAQILAVISRIGAITVTADTKDAGLVAAAFVLGGDKTTGPRPIGVLSGAGKGI